MNLDLLDRKNKYSNGFCHWPIPAWVKPDGEWVPSSTNFTSLADPTAVGSGLTALTTLMHEVRRLLPCASRLLYFYPSIVLACFDVLTLLSLITHCSFDLLSRPGMQLISPTLSNPALCSARNVRPLVWHMLRTNQCSWTPSLEMPRGELNMPKILMAKVFPLLLSRRRSSRRIPLPFSAFGPCYQSAISKRYHFPLFHCHLVYCAYIGD